MDSDKRMTRRGFLRGAAALTGAGLTAACSSTSTARRTEGGLELAPFGRTGHVSTRALFGGYALAHVAQEVADRVLGVLMEYGVNHIDTAPSYGMSERRIGPWMENHRDEFFLATKTDRRLYDQAWHQIRRSLKDLHVDQVDLLQLHNVVEEFDWVVALGKGEYDKGALRAAIEARDAGLVRFIGVTGHGLAAPAMHLRSLEEFDFDSVLLPYNYPLMKNPQYAADFAELLETCDRQGVAVQSIKSVAAGEWGATPKNANTWYQPLTEPQAIDGAVHYALGRGGVFLNTVGDVDLLPLVLDAATRAQGSPSTREMERLVADNGMTPLWA